MDRMRRHFLTAFLPGGILAAAVLRETHSQQQEQYPQVPGMPHPQRPAPPTLPDERPPAIPMKTILREKQKEITKDVERLFALAKDLKAQAAKIDSTEVLSVNFLHRTEEIEKLAKKIRGLAQG